MKTMWVDSHCHLDSYDDLPQVLANARAAQVNTLLAIGIGEGPDEMHHALDLAHAHPQIYATAGIHPQEAHRATPEALAKLADLAADPRCIAIGEIGLDYYHLDNPDIPIQQAAFIAQMKIAAAARKPILIHCRTSELATPARQGKSSAPPTPGRTSSPSSPSTGRRTGLPGIMHCFSGTSEQAERSLAAGFYLSFAGNLTYPKSTIHPRSRRATPPPTASSSKPTRPFSPPSPSAASATSPPSSPTPRAALAELRGISLRSNSPRKPPQTSTSSSLPPARCDTTVRRIERLFYEGRTHGIRSTAST